MKLITATSYISINKTGLVIKGIKVFLQILKYYCLTNKSIVREKKHLKILKFKDKRLKIFLKIYKIFIFKNI